MGISYVNGEVGGLEWSASEPQRHRVRYKTDLPFKANVQAFIVRNRENNREK